MLPYADPVYEQAIAEWKRAVAAYKERYVPDFRLTRKRVLSYARRLANTEVVERGKATLPASVKNEQGKTVAMVYERKGEVSLTLRIADTYAEWLALRHPFVRRAKFPKNRNWYVVPVDGTFPNAQMVYRTIKRAKKFCKPQ
jgi:predicted DNA-binding protein (MmcQ/YjbR family)